MIPKDVALIIYKFLHELNMNEVLTQLIEQDFILQNIMTYLKKRSFYPYSISKRLDYKNKSFYYKNKIQKFIHYKLFSKCLKEIILLNIFFSNYQGI